MKAGRKRLYVPVTQRGIAMTQPLVQLTIQKLKVATRLLKGLEKINIAPFRHQLIGPVDGTRQSFRFYRNGLTEVVAKCPFGKVGDFLYLKEPFIQYMDNVFVTRSMIEQGDGHPWKSPRFMPKAAASVWVQITDIYPQRLSDMTVDDIYDEGVVFLNDFFDERADRNKFGVPGDESTFATTARESWDKLFGKCFGKNIIEQDPFVWVIKYQLTERPVSSK